MSALQIFLLGMMVVCTPSLLILVWALWRAPLVDDVEVVDDPVSNRPFIRRKGRGA